MIKSVYIINKNEIKKSVIFLLTSNNFKNLYNAIVRQQHTINIIINIIYKNFFFDTCLTFFSIDYKFFNNNKVFDINAFNIH